MDGIFIDCGRPKSKKEVKEAVEDDPTTVHIESTGIIPGYAGPVSEAPDGTYSFVGPDPYRSRKFYGTITVRDGVASCS
jgi:hypothetical protein